MLRERRVQFICKSPQPKVFLIPEVLRFSAKMCNWSDFCDTNNVIYGRKHVSLRQLRWQKLAIVLRKSCLCVSRISRVCCSCCRGGGKWVEGFRQPRGSYRFLKQLCNRADIFWEREHRRYTAVIHTITPNGMMDKSWNSLATGVNVRVRMMIPESHDKLLLNKKHTAGLRQLPI